MGILVTSYFHLAHPFCVPFILCVLVLEGRKAALMMEILVDLVLIRVILFPVTLSS